MIVTPLGARITVRFARKPIWMPTAPSKLFRITNHTFYDPDEINQIKALNYAYKSQMQTIYKYMEMEFYVPATQSGGMPLDFIEKEFAEDELLYEENDRVNADVGRKREKFFEERFKEMEEKVMEEKLAIEEALIEVGQKMNEFVISTKSDPDNFVTRDNIDIQIEKALENPLNFEFCIDKQGRRLNANMTDRNETQKQLP